MPVLRICQTSLTSKAQDISVRGLFEKEMKLWLELHQRGARMLEGCRLVLSQTAW
jgi:hypothetical protein